LAFSRERQQGTKKMTKVNKDAEIANQSASFNRRTKGDS
jgi:hypothetical protein